MVSVNHIHISRIIANWRLERETFIDHIIRTGIEDKSRSSVIVAMALWLNTIFLFRSRSSNTINSTESHGAIASE